MALEDSNGSNGMVMPVAPMGYGYPMGGFGGNGGFGYGGDWAWILLLLLIGGNGWGFGGGFGGGGMWPMMGMMGGFDGFGLYPWMNQAEITTQGFQMQNIGNQVSDLRTDVNRGFGDVQLGIAGVNQNICQSTGQIQNSLCQGFAGTTAAVTAAQNGITQQLYNNEIASLNRSFAEQTANTGAINGVSRQLADCCCENRLATQALNSTIIAENCADREALSNGIRDIITNQTANTQRILDVMCQDKIDAKNERIAALENQVNMQNLAASQAAQTAQLLQDNTAQTRDLIQRIAPYPQPSFIVGNPYGYGYYGNGNWNNNCGCGCGCNG